MPQIAQQDYIRIEIKNSLALTDAEKAEIAAKVANGTIFDCILVLGDSTSVYRISGYDAVAEAIFYGADGTIGYGE